MSGFRTGTLLRETMLNLRSRWLQALIPVAIGIASAAIAIGWTVQDATQAIERADELVERGANTVVVAARVGLDTATCESLAHLEGIRASGARMASEQLRVTGPANERVAMRVVTLGYVETLWPGLRSHDGVLIGEGLADSLQVAPGGNIVVLDGQGGRRVVHVGGIAPNNARQTEMRSALLLIAPPVGQARQCVIEAEPGAVDGVIALSSTVFEDARAARLYSPDKQVLSPQDQYERRPSVVAGLMAGALTAAGVLIYWASQRTDYSLYRLLHLGRAGTLLRLSAETILLALLPLSFGFAVGLILWAPLFTTLSLSAVAIAAVQAFLVGAVAPIFGLAIVGLSDPVRTMRGGSW